MVRYLDLGGKQCFLSCKTFIMKINCAGHYMFQFAIFHPAPPISMPEETKLHGFSSRLPSASSSSWVQSMRSTSRSEGDKNHFSVFASWDPCLGVIIIWLYPFPGGHISTQEVFSSQSWSLQASRW